MSRLSSPEIRPGLFIISISLLALLLCNIGYASHYFYLLGQMIEVKIGGFVFQKQLQALINEGLMAVFFLLITIEIRYECLYGFLNNPKYLMLPLMGALGGVLAPASIYLLFNYNTANAVGWAIPVATDIAFSLACLMLLGKAFSPRLRIFLLSLAIFDDLAAILIVAVYYTKNLSLWMLVLALGITLFMFVLREMGCRRHSVYFVTGAILWISLLKSGVHATLTGSVVALMLPMKNDQGHQAKRLYENLLPWVQYLILPLFTFANSGVVLSQSGSSSLFLGIVLGLIVGKPLGIISFSYLSNYLKLSSMPKGMNYLHIVGISLLCGIGFTVSLFIGSLAFEHQTNLLNTMKVSVLLASLLSSFLGLTFLYVYCEKENE